MGLCKCPKRRVTNLFCFVHRVNVCEDCIVSSHPRCVVNSYLKWLEDSDYDAVCILCAHSLQNGPVVRLICYDVFHQSCLDAYARNLSPNSHITCPKCKDSLLPPHNIVSPVAQQLRQVLSNFGWAPRDHSLIPNDQSVHIELMDDDDDDQLTSDHLGDVLLTSTPKPSTTQRFDKPASIDVYTSSDESKYQKKSAVSMLTKWSRNHHASLTADDGTATIKRYLLLAFLLVVAVVTVIIMLTRVGRDMAEKDPTLNWKYNPHLRQSE